MLMLPSSMVRRFEEYHTQDREWGADSPILPQGDTGVVLGEEPKLFHYYLYCSPGCVLVFTLIPSR